MSRKLESKTALITGGSRGIGRAICVRLASEGAKIFLHYHRDLKAATETNRLIGRTAKFVQADLRSPMEIKNMFRALAGVKLDILVNNAGIWRSSPLGSTTVQLMNEIVDTNLKGAFWVAHCALHHLKDGARLINISSVAGRIGVRNGRSLYGATKAAVDSLTRNWALELAPRQILVNAVAPGYVTTDMTASYFSDPVAFNRTLRRQPLGRLGVPEDVANVVAFLCSDDARFITGQIINVSGGSVI
jgi:3-oxoacyl-[acyl-carrier protein] reductase